jgi:acetoin utilization deacetylase AcuC-like enzyme
MVGSLASIAERARRRARRVRSRILGPRIEVVFHAGYAPPDGTIADHKRAARILDHVLTEGWLAPSQVRVPRPLEVAALRRVHDDAYLESLDVPLAVARALGGDAPPPAGVASGYLAAQRWATAGTMLATRLALRRRDLVVNLGGGFHHAERARGGGFCLFHDVAVALEDARARGFSGRVLIVDLDLHQGDGTRRIYRDDPRVTAASVHATAWDEEEAPRAIDRALGSGVGDATYLEAVRDVMDLALSAGEPDLVYYLAGVDVAIEDTMGSWRVSADAIARRDQLVIERLRGRPMVMVLAGGYGREAWRHSARTLTWLLSGHDRPIPSARETELSVFRRVARALGESKLGSHGGDGDGFDITAADLYGDLTGRTDDHILGFYSAYGVELAFERYGLMDHMHSRGYPRLRLDVDPRHGSGGAVTVRTDDADRRTLVELVVRDMREVLPYRLLSIEWLLLQDPLAHPTPERPLLPGQQHPGLGAVRVMMGMLGMAAERLGMDGLTFLPAHYHVAAQARGTLRFLDPRDEAAFVAVKEAVGARTLLEATQLVTDGKLVVESTGERYAWKPARMVIPLSAQLRAAVEGPDYDRRVEEAAAQIRLRLVEGDEPVPEG